MTEFKYQLSDFIAAGYDPNKLSPLWHDLILQVAATVWGQTRHQDAILSGIQEAISELPADQQEAILSTVALRHREAQRMVEELPAKTMRAEAQVVLVRAMIEQVEGGKNVH